jgi:hypothetical protein
MKRSVKSLAAGVALLGALTAFSASALASSTVTIDSDGANNGLSALQIFQKYLGSDPIDGFTDSTHLRETSSSYVGNVFQFHLNNSGDYDGSNTDRQRQELKAYNSSPSNVKAFNGNTMTYDWYFRIMNDFTSSGGFCHIFQLKASGGDDGAPILTFSLENGYLQFRHSPIGADMSQVTTLAKTASSNVVGTWVHATVTAQNTDSGKLTMTLKKLDGTTLMSYSGTKDLWRDSADFNRPKWGIYRKIYSGMPAADVQFYHFQITKN